MASSHLQMSEMFAGFILTTWFLLVKEKALFLVFVKTNSPPKKNIFHSMFDLSRTVWWEGRVCMCHISRSDYCPIPGDCYEFSLINDPESDATFFHHPSPTSSTVVSLDYQLVGWEQRLTDLICLIYSKLVGSPCSLEYFTYQEMSMMHSKFPITLQENI